ncbi:MAG: aminotransferase class I/II-fold pyridoxal phosphate-dependent enzyme [Candidatus Thermoplasmatota archaeon]|nr:aminotransferase class I/II-fold pyridoxal phosphate-dependent enzyme [Candidatus Thermoplasmatota archaeon]
MGDATKFLKEEYDELVEKDFDWKIKVLEGASAPKSVVDEKEVLMLCSNNYLNLSNHPKLKDAAIKATEKYGAGSGSVRPIAGTMDIHMELEEKIGLTEPEQAPYFSVAFIAASLSFGWLLRFR